MFHVRTLLEVRLYLDVKNKANVHCALNKAINFIVNISLWLFRKICCFVPRGAILN